MSQLYDKLQQIVDLSDKDKTALFKDSYHELLPIFRQVDPDTKGLSFISEIIGTAASADGKVDPSEMRIMKIVTESADIKLTDQEIESLILESGSPDIKEGIVRLSAVLSPSLKAHLFMMTACVCALDDRISSSEIDLIADFLDENMS